MSSRSSDAHAEDVAEQDVAQVQGVRADGADEDHAEGKRRGKQDPDGRVLLQSPLPGEEPDAQRHRDGRHQGPDQELAFQQVGHGHAREDGMRHRVPDERHGAQNHVAAHHGAGQADQHRHEHAALHEAVDEGFSEPGDHDAPPASAATIAFTS